MCLLYRLWKKAKVDNLGGTHSHSYVIMEDMLNGFMWGCGVLFIIAVIVNAVLVLSKYV